MSAIVAYCKIGLSFFIAQLNELIDDELCNGTNQDKFAYSAIIDWC